MLKPWRDGGIEKKRMCSPIPYGVYEPTELPVAEGADPRLAVPLQSRPPRGTFVAPTERVVMQPRQLRVHDRKADLEVDCHEQDSVPSFQ